MVLFDSDVGPEPTVGAFGGSMGYAQKTGQDGFEGGWLGLGIDEFGNYAKGTEGRNGGISSSGSNRASIRGDGTGTSGYEFLKASGTLSPAVAKKSSTTAAYGHKYRFTADARDKNHLYITLERDTGSGYQVIINKFDAKDSAYHQTTTPENIRFAFTSGTGWGCNNHEIDKLKVYGRCSGYNPLAHSVATNTDIVNDFTTSTDYDNGKKYITTKISGKTQTITAVHLNNSGNVENYSSANSNLKYRVIPYLSNSTCNEQSVISDTSGNVAILDIVKGQATVDKDIVMPKEASRDSRFLITAIDYGKLYDLNPDACYLDTNTNGTLKGLPSCVNSDTKYQSMYGMDAWDRCGIHNGAPCSQAHAGRGFGIYDDDYGCLMCTADFNATCSSDNFAIRPNKLSLSSSESDFNNLLRSSEDYNITIKAYDDGIVGGDITTNLYNITDAKNFLTITQTLLHKDGTEASGDMSGSFSWTSNFDITDGKSTDGTAQEVAGIKFDDVGRVTLRVEDRQWAKVDLNDSRGMHDPSVSTLNNCNGAYVCGDMNLTILPHHFSFTNLKISNSNGNPGSFTYLSNLNPSNPSTFAIAARVSTTIEARNKDEGVTHNFKAGANYYENNVSVLLNVVDDKHGSANETAIASSLLGFVSGSKNIAWNESNTSQMLRFNFSRVNNITQNPFMVSGSELNITLNSVYPSVNIGSDNSGIATASGGATFVYGRTHATRQRYENNNGTAFIYYESYCYGVDADNVSCNKSLLPSSSQHTNDMRWYINSSHNVAKDGNLTSTSVTDKSLGVVTESSRDEATPSISKVTLHYDESYGYPYKTTMENAASSWLIYNRDNPTATRNEFSVEFNKAGTGWSGAHETNTTTADPGTIKTNRRSMW